MQTEEEKNAVRQRGSEFLVKLRTRIQEMGHTWETEQMVGSRTTIDGIRAPFILKEQHTTGVGWEGMLRQSEPNGKFHISIGGYGDRRAFLEPKEGFDVEKIAKALSDYVTQQNDLTKALDAGIVIATRINKEYGLGVGSDIEISVNHTNGKLRFTVDTYVTKERARELIPAVQALLDTE